MLASLVMAGCETSDEVITPDQAETTLSPLSESLKTVYTEALDCTADSMDLYRNWCAVTQMGDADFLAPDLKTSYLGLSMIYDPSQTVSANSLETTRFSVLHLDSQGALITDITPSNPEEVQELLEISLSLTDNLKNGFGGDFTLSADFYDYLMSEQENQTLYPMSLSENGRSTTYVAGLPSELYFVPNLGYVAIEDKGDGLAYVSVFSLMNIISDGI